MKFVVAIDGLAASGKGTIASRLASHFNFKYLDTGLLYRAIAKLTIIAGSEKSFTEQAIDIAGAFNKSYLELEGLRSNDVGNIASKVASIPKVREELIRFQKTFSCSPGGSVLDGRDIGTIICPDADVKLIICADLKVRAKRRFDELLPLNHDLKLKNIVDDLKRRDDRDINRSNAPFKISEEALLIDTTELSIEAAVDKAIEFVELRLKSKLSEEKFKKQ